MSELAAPDGKQVLAVITEQIVLHAYVGYRFVEGENEDGTQAFMLDFDVPTGPGVAKRYTAVFDRPTLEEFDSRFTQWKAGLVFSDPDPEPASGVIQGLTEKMGPGAVAEERDWRRRLP